MDMERVDGIDSGARRLDDTAAAGGARNTSRRGISKLVGAGNSLEVTVVDGEICGLFDE